MAGFLLDENLKRYKKGERLEITNIFQAPVGNVAIGDNNILYHQPPPPQQQQEQEQPLQQQEQEQQKERQRLYQLQTQPREQEQGKVQEQHEHQAATPIPTLTPTQTCRALDSDDYDDGDNHDSREHVSISASGLCIPYPSTVGRYYVDGFDITLALYEFQKLTLSNATERKLCWESHVHRLLSLSSLLLVTPGRMHKDIRQILGDDGVSSLQSYLAARFGSDDFEFSTGLTLKVTEIIKKVEKGKIDRDDAVMALLSLKSDATDLEFKIVKSIKALIESLPNAVVYEKPNEVELLSRYLNAFLLPLFDEPEKGILFHWHDIMNQEANKTTATISRHRPDSAIPALDGYSIDYSRGFGEVKCQANANNAATIGKDLVRLGLFAKNAIDVDDMAGILTFQAVGTHITFYIVKLMSDGVYMMYELRSFTVPASINQILSLPCYFDDMYFILNVYYTHCVKMSPELANEVKNMKRSTLLTPEFDRILDITASNKRHRITKRFH